MSHPTAGYRSFIVPLWIQVLGWCLGILACIAGMLDLIAQWDKDLATLQFLVLVIAPILWMITSRDSFGGATDSIARLSNRRLWIFAVVVGVTSWMTCWFVGRNMVDLPPAYHDEYSYLFQARTLLAGVLSTPSHPTHPELFDQMHVLNEGRMASRYYPGTGLWLAPFVALGHPYWGQWLASALASMFVFWVGNELGGARVAIVGGMASALSPGIALFGNLLLAHQPTLLGLSIFLWAFVKWQRTHAARDALIAGCGLSLAMICRPMTAAGFGLPFGVAFLVEILVPGRAEPLFSRNLRIRSVFAMGLPLIVGWAVMLAYHRDVTGTWTTSPYQLYTDLYTPRHVYGFNNAIRGAEKIGPKVIEAYDRWAVNLTPELAATNVLHRGLASLMWSFDLLPLLLASAVALGMTLWIDRRWLAIGFAIVSLHAVHVPYWYAGIMGWHYVFESVLSWALVLGLGTDLLVQDWRLRGRALMPVCWFFLLAVSLIGLYVPTQTVFGPKAGGPRIAAGIGTIQYPRRQYAAFDQWLNANVTDRPALVLIEADPDDQHVDYVVNAPGLKAALLRARLSNGTTEFDAIARAFPDRAVYLCQPGRKTIRKISIPKPR
ncbi:ArnT family glycosyltransferase [Schlesneria paludicola]|uniref:ArnT family glycosyltransferase n=1 Tax=Schlesneria paludicola TaxID=360056 RepID=UPI0012FB7F42|nr:hypothetical protein [Schlesneria paludicola]